MERKGEEYQFLGSLEGGSVDLSLNLTSLLRCDCAGLLQRKLINDNKTRVNVSSGRLDCGGLENSIDGLLCDYFLYI